METDTQRYREVAGRAVLALVEALEVAAVEEGDDRVLDKHLAGLTVDELDLISDAGVILTEVTYRLAHDPTNPKNQKVVDQTEVWEENQRRWDANHQEH